MTVLVTGANGQLGREMRIVSRGSADRYIFSDVCEAEGLSTRILDISDLDAVRALVQSEGVDVIVNCAAYTNVEAAESDYYQAEKLNADAPEILSVVMNEVGGLLVHVSTDYVFGGEDSVEPISESQACAPLGVYGLTKLHGEQRIIASGCRFVIVRTAWLYSEFGKNFCKTMLRLTSERDSVSVVSDQFGTPTYALDLAKAIAAILASDRSKQSGIFHFTNEGECSWYDFAREIAAVAGNASCDVKPCRSEEYPSSVKRPSYSVLDKTKIKQTFGLQIPQWQESLRVCMANMMDNK